MKFLLSNDDGIHAPGIHALAMELQRDHDVAIVAPDSQRSGVGHAFTYTEPLRVQEVRLPGIESKEVFSTNGMPADCVKLGCANLGLAPDIVISGINLGANLGTDVLYSGTIAAAMEAALLHKPAIAVSVYAYHPKHLDVVARIARGAAEYIVKHPLKTGMILNINVPDLPQEEIRGIRRAKLCFQEYLNIYEERIDPRGLKYYWLPLGKQPGFAPQEGTDEMLIRQKYVTVTPIGFDAADYAYMEQMELADFTW